MIWPSYFDGPTGREIARLGGAPAQACGVYLSSGHEANMIGLYRIPLPILKLRLGSLSARQLDRAVAALGSAGFADYDRITEYVWVRQMAYYRLGLEDGPLKKDDKRVGFVQRLYADAEPNPFLGAFYSRYRTDLHLRKERTYAGAVSLLRLEESVRPLETLIDHNPSGFEGAPQAPPKPIERSVTEAVTETAPQIVSSELAKPPTHEPPVFVYPTVGKGGTEWSLTKAHLADLQADYPNLDVLTCCRNALAWCKNNPRKRKTAGGMGAFLVNWLNRATNGSGAASSSRAYARPTVGEQNVQAVADYAQQLGVVPERRRPDVTVTGQPQLPPRGDA